MGLGRAFTEEELASAVRRIDVEGERSCDVARSTGRTLNTLRVVLHRYRKGTWRPRGNPARDESHRVELEAIVRDRGIWRLKLIAHELGVPVSTVSHRLLAIGLDREMRIELAGERRAA